MNDSIKALAMSKAITAMALMPLVCSAPMAAAQTEALESIAVTVEGSKSVMPAAAPPESQRAGIEEIVVTAQKREENLQDVPISISAFTGDQLESAGTDTTKDLGLITPGLQVTELAGFTLIFLRGVGSDIFVPSADPSVATYIDGIYVAPGQGFSQELGGVERVEVLKGPQGTLFGRNSTGGAISVTTKKPGGDFEGSVSSSYATFNTSKTKAYVNIPLTDSFAFSVAGLYSTSESYFDRIGPYADGGIPDDYAKAGRLRIRWDLADNLELLVTGQRVEQNSSASLISANHYPSLLMGTILALTPQPSDEFQDRTTAVDTDPFSKSSQRQVYGQITWNLPGLDIKLLGSDQYVSGTNQTDFDGTSRPLVSFYSPSLFTDVQTAELQFLSNSDTPWSDRLTWVGGLYGFKSNGGFDPVALQVSNSAIRLPTNQVISLIPQGVRDLPLVSQLLGRLPNIDSVSLWLTGLLETESLAGYAQGTFVVNDWMSVTAGGRYQREKRTQTESTVNLRNFDGSFTRVNGYAPQATTVSNFSPKLSLDFQVAEDVLVYASAARGFKSQTYNIINIYTPPDYVAPEEVTSYELGFKSTLADNTVRLNAAIFQNETKNLQSSFVSLLAGGAVNFQTAGGARTRGAEFDVTWLPMPDSNPGLMILAGGAYLDGIYTDFTNGSGFNDAGLFTGNNDFTGKEVVRTPKFTGNLGVAQTFDVSWGSIELAADGYYNSGFYFLPSNSKVSEEPAYSLLNARVSALYAPWNVRLTVFGDNLLDETYNISQFHTDFGRLDTQSPPVTYGLRLNWDF